MYDKNRFEENFKKFEKDFRVEFKKRELLTAEFRVVKPYFVDKLNKFMRRERIDGNIHKFKFDVKDIELKDGKKFSGKVDVMFEGDKFITFTLTVKDKKGGGEEEIFEDVSDENKAEIDELIIEANSELNESAPEATNDLKVTEAVDAPQENDEELDLDIVDEEDEE